MIEGRLALVVEADSTEATCLGRTLHDAGFEVTHAPSGEEALVLLQRVRPRLVVLDVDLPGLDGLEVCRQLRRVSDVFVLMVSDRGEELDVVLGLEVGADDYMVKPVSARELRARVAALLRRSRDGVLRDGVLRHGAAPGGAAPGGAARDNVPAGRSPGGGGVPDGAASNREVDRLAAWAAGTGSRETDLGGGLVLNVARREVTCEGDVLPLTRTEFDLFAALAARAGAVCSRVELVREVWDESYLADTHLVDVHVSNLRKKLRARAPHGWIHTVRGVGYRLDPVLAQPVPHPVQAVAAGTSRSSTMRPVRGRLWGTHPETT